MKALRAVAVVELLAIVGLGATWLLRGGGEAAAAPAAEGDADPSPAIVAEPVPGVEPGRGGAGTAPDAASATAPVDAPIAADDPIGLVLCGVVHPQGLPQRASVSIESAAGELPRVFTAGTFAVPGLVPGPVQVRIAANGFETLQRTITLAPSPRVQQHEFVLTRKVTVRVALLTPDGVPLVEAMGPARVATRHLTVIASREQPADIVPHDLRAPLPSLATWKDNLGLRRRGPPLPKQFLGELDLAEPPPLVVSAFLGGARVASAPLEPGQEEVVLTATVDGVQGALGRVRFRLVDAAGGPVTQAGIHFDNAFGYRPDERGEVVIEGCVAGRHMLIVRSDAGFCSRLFETSPGEQVDFGDVSLMVLEAAWRGTVTDSDGKPVAADVALCAIDAVDPWLGLLPESGKRAEVDGTFTLLGLRPGRFLVVASVDRGRAFAAAVIDARQPPVPLTLRVEPTVPLRVEANLHGFEAACVLVRDGSGSPLASTVVTSGRIQPLRLPPGSYDVDVSTGPGRVRRARVTLTAEGGTLVVP